MTSDHNSLRGAGACGNEEAMSNWANERAESVFQHLLMIELRNDGKGQVLDVIAAELQRVADECVETLWERVAREEYSHAKAAVTLDIEAIEQRFPKGTESK